MTFLKITFFLFCFCLCGCKSNYNINDATLVKFDSNRTVIYTNKSNFIKLQIKKSFQGCNFYIIDSTKIKNTPFFHFKISIPKEKKRIFPLRKSHENGKKSERFF